MDENDLQSKERKVNRAMAIRRVPVEYILRRVPQEGLEGEPVDRIREALDNKYSGAYMHNFCGKEQQLM